MNKELIITISNSLMLVNSYEYSKEETIPIISKFLEESNYNETAINKLINILLLNDILVYGELYSTILAKALYHYHLKYNVSYIVDMKQINFIKFY
jgi:hypothetical protein